MQIQWLLQPFDALSPHQLYQILQLRNEVFVVEQQCVFQDADNNDQGAHHLMGLVEGWLVAYTRLIAPGSIYKQPSIGRVVTSPKARGSGAGRALMRRSIAAIYELFGKKDIKIGAQLYLKAFYESLSFEQVGEGYLEDGIEHIYMIRKYSDLF